MGRFGASRGMSGIIADGGQSGGVDLLLGVSAGAEAIFHRDRGLGGVENEMPDVAL